jgi:SAM-dependent methyltransferase
MQAFRSRIEAEALAYGPLAEEYYDPQRHPTCANFRTASALLLGRMLASLRLETAVVCEVGAGRSIVPDLVPDWAERLCELVLVDASPEMLAHSATAIEQGAVPEIADARALPFPADRFDLVIASLGDPFNDQAFWCEMRRVLVPGGVCLFTCPAYDWASTFRGKQGSGVIGQAEFVTEGGEACMVPSLIRPPAAQIEMIKDAGLTLMDHGAIPFHAIDERSRSWKLCAERGPDAPIVEAYVAARDKECSGNLLSSISRD